MGKLGDEIADKVVLHEHCDCTQQNQEMRSVLLDTMNLVREIHKMVANSDMRARMAFSSATKAEERMEKLVEKNNKDFKFLLDSPQHTNKFKNNKNNWQGGINV